MKMLRVFLSSFFIFFICLFSYSILCLVFPVSEHGEVYTGLVSAPDDLSLLNLNRVPLVQSARSIFTDYKALNFAMVQNVYR